MPAAGSSWDRVATWYDGWVGQYGSHYHQSIALPAAVRLLEPRAGEEILDVGAGQGVLAPHVTSAGARYTGVDASPRLISLARRRHGAGTRFFVGDATRLQEVAGLREAVYDGGVYLLSIQDMDPLAAIFASLDWALAPTGRVVLLMTHPAFRQPRHSGWGFDESRKLTFRRIDSYLSQMAVPMKAVGRGPATRSYHRPISAYVNGLARFGFAVDALEELPDLEPSARPRGSGNEPHSPEIPLFLGLRARRG